MTEDLAIDLALIPAKKRRGLVNRTLWETLRSTLLQGVLKKAGGAHSLFSAVQAARAAQQNTEQNSGSDVKGARIVYGRLKRAPKLPSKPALQSSESSTDDLSGSEESSSSEGDDNNEQNNAKDEASKVSILSGNGTEDDDNESETLHENNGKIKSSTSKTGDLSIEIKIGKDNDKGKTLLAGNAIRAFASAISGNDETKILWVEKTILSQVASVF